MSRQASAAWSGESRGPSALIRSMMSWTPGFAASENSEVAKLTLCTRLPEVIHSVPVCQPSTLGGFRSFWPI